MKRKISDLLDGCQVDTLDIGADAPLSSQRIKELTMKKVKKNHNVRRLGVRILIAAAIIASLSVTAFAAEYIFGAGDVLREMLNLQLVSDRQRAEEDGVDVTIRETISEDQVAVVSQMGKVFEERSYSDQGTTVTATAAYGDEYMLYLYLSVTAPEGTVLPNDILYTFWDLNAEGDYNELGGNAPYDAHFMTIDIDPMPDAVPTDNQKDFVVTISAQPGFETKFNDGYTKFLSIKGIYQQVVNVNDDEDGYKLVAPGEFTIDLTMSHPVEAVEVDVNGLTYGGEKSRIWTHDSECLPTCAENLTGETDSEIGLPIHAESWEYTVTAKRLSISPMRADWECVYECTNEQISLGLGFQVVMKDGTSPMKTSIGGDMYGDGHSMGTIYFTVPIDLDDIDYILIGDSEIGQTHKVFLPDRQ